MLYLTPQSSPSFRFSGDVGLLAVIIAKVSTRLPLYLLSAVIMGPSEPEEGRYAHISLVRA